MALHDFPLRKEVQDFAKCIERLFSSQVGPDGRRFSADEIELLRYYRDELDHLISNELQER